MTINASFNNLRACRVEVVWLHAKIISIVMASYGECHYESSDCRCPWQQACRIE